MADPASDFYLDPVYVQGVDFPALVVGVPQNFDSSNPEHVAAARQVYDKANDPQEIGKAINKYLSDQAGQKNRITAANEQAAKYAAEVSSIERVLKSGAKLEGRFGGGYRSTPLTSKEVADYMIGLGKAKNSLSAAQKEVDEARKPIEPKRLDIQLPQASATGPDFTGASAATPAQEQPTTRQELEPKIDYPQDEWYRGNQRKIADYVGKLYQAGIPHTEVEARRKSLDEQLRSQWVPEVRYLGGKMWRHDAPDKAVEVADKAGMVKDIFSNHVKEASKMISGTQQLDQMIDLAKEAADPKTSKDRRNDIYLALQSSFKAVTTAIAGTSDAVQQQEFLRLNAPLDALNFYKALVDPASTSKFLKANPQSFANAIEGVRKIASSRALQQYGDAEKIHKQFPDVYSKSALPTLPKYMQDIRESLKPQIIEKSQLPKAQPVTTRGGVQFQRR
jgi:hypothetical protein